jgi:hypothetical protein
MMIGGPHHDFVVYVGADYYRSTRPFHVYIGLWQRASIAEGELPWLFEWSWTPTLPRIRLWGVVEFYAFGRVWVWEL